VGDQQLELTDDVASEGEIGFDPPVERGDAELETRALVPGERLPELTGIASSTRCFCAAGSATLAS
jgi:hypothetical protein